MCRWASTLRRFESTTISQSVGTYSPNDRALHSTLLQSSHHHCKNLKPYLLFLKTPALWDVMQCRLAFSHRPFGSEQCFHLKGQAALFSDCWILNMEATRSSATSENICRSTRHNIPETWILSSFLLPIKRKHNITMWKREKLYKILTVPGNSKSFIDKNWKRIQLWCNPEQV
jgi:hypothetical protein